jgi:hypothetical protein
MKQKSGLVFGICLVAGAAGFSIACGGGAGETDAPPVLNEPHDGFQKRLVERAYPYKMGENTFVCAEWEIVSPAGKVVDVKRDWLPMDTMNRNLRNVGTPEAVPHVDETFRDALLAKGISRIETCEQANEYVRLANESLKFVQLSELDFPELANFSQEALADFELENAAVMTDKIINGSNFDHFSTVGTGCTGQLIGPFAMLTAAHCLPPDPNGDRFVEMPVWIQVGGGAQQCVSHPGGGACILTGAPNVWVSAHPNWDGSAFRDQAIVIRGGGWFAPANTSARWTRFAATHAMAAAALFSVAPVQIAGYGARTTAGGGGGFGRLGNSTHTVTSITPNGVNFRMPRLNSTSSGTCGGDSGSGAHSTSLVTGGHSVSLGILWGSDSATGACTTPGSNMVYNAPDGTWISNIVNFFGGNCTTHTDALFSAPYVRCF